MKHISEDWKWLGKEGLPLKCAFINFVFYCKKGGIFSQHMQIGFSECIQKLPQV